MSAPIGTFTFMLHSHLPYARQAGMWPHGEEWVHEAIAETYVPLLNALYDLREEGVPYRLSIGITPILAEQLADPLIIDHFVGYATERAARAAKDIERFELNGDERMRNLARFYHHWYGRVLTSFVDRYNRDLLGAFRTLQDEGLIEVATCAAIEAGVQAVGVFLGARRQGNGAGQRQGNPETGHFGSHHHTQVHLVREGPPAPNRLEP